MADILGMNQQLLGCQMINYKWKILEIFVKEGYITQVRYHLTGSDDQNTVETEGEHTFSKGTVKKGMEDILESDLTQWIEQDTTQLGQSHIKLLVERQLDDLKNRSQIDFPWLSNTFTI
jgi:ribosomal protein S8